MADTEEARTPEPASPFEEITEVPRFTYGVIELDGDDCALVIDVGRRRRAYMMSADGRAGLVRRLLRIPADEPVPPPRKERGDG